MRGRLKGEVSGERAYVREWAWKAFWKLRGECDRGRVWKPLQYPLDCHLIPTSTPVKTDGTKPVVWRTSLWTIQRKKGDTIKLTYDTCRTYPVEPMAGLVPIGLFKVYQSIPMIIRSCNIIFTSAPDPTALVMGTSLFGNVPLLKAETSHLERE